MASKTVKIVLIGCGAVVFLGLIAVGVGGYFLKQWGTSKMKTLENIAGTEDSEYGKKTADLRKQYPFEPPSDNLITENQLERFLAVRREMFSVYQKYEPEFKKLNSDQALKGAMKGLEMWNEIRLANANALQSQRMSPDEYAYLVTTVYSTWLAKAAHEQLKGRTYTESMADTYKQGIEQIDKQLANPNLPEETRKALENQRDIMQKQLDNIDQNEGLQQADSQLASIPKENIELFQKHQQEIEKYAMSGLEFIGL